MPEKPINAELHGNLEPGKVVGGRYEIAQLLGEGRVGAVYKAKDRALDRVVALKVIRPEIAAHPEVFRRFKREVILGRQIIHKNVVRIYDLNEGEGLKYITMEYVLGRNLEQILKAAGKLDPAAALSIIRQACLALDAAHAEGVIHQDLKPQNIIVEDQGRVWVTDFGVTRCLEEAGVAETGLFVGTPQYLSPEQARGETLDARTDVFALGVILYELLTGSPPFRATNARGRALPDFQERVVPPMEVDSRIPQPVSDLALQCLAIDREQRCQTAKELYRELESLQGPPTAAETGPISVTATVVTRPSRGKRHRRRRHSNRRRRWTWIMAVAAIVTVALGGLFFKQRLGIKGPAQPRALTLLVADFANSTGEPVFDGTLESTLNIAMEGASFITSYNRGRARQLGTQLRPGTTRLDEAVARLVAVREGVSVVLGGSIDHRDGGYVIVLRAVDAVTGKLILTQEITAPSKETVLNGVGKVAVSVRRALGDATPESVQLAAAETYTSSSLEVAHIYAQAMESQWVGNWEDTIKYFLQTVELDPDFGRAYAGLAVAYQNLKQRDKAEENFKKALALLDRMSPREKYRTLGVYYLIFVRNYPLAIDTLRKLVEEFPGDSSGYNNLSIAYVYTRNIAEALNASRRALQNNPANLQHRLNYSQYSMYAGDYKTSIAEGERILKQNPGFEFAYVPVALSQLALGNVAEARKTYTRLEKVNPLGYSFAKAGEGDLEMYLGQYKEAIGPLQQGIEADQKEKNFGMMALKYIAKAEAHLALGEHAQAVDAARKASQLDSTEFVLYPAARLLIQADEEAEARGLAKTLNEKLQIQTKSYARLVEGEIALQRKQIPEAVEAFRNGQQLLDSWIAHFLLGRAHMEAGRFEEALAELEICQKRQGEATDFLFADTTTLRYLPPLYYWLGRAQEGTGSKDAARTSYQAFLRLRSEANTRDPLVEDAKRRIGS